MRKRGQQVMGMSFSMIFAIILIVVFIVVAFIAIGYFLEIDRATKVGTFYEDLQGAIDDVWAGQAAEMMFNIDLPGDITTVCFANLSARITNPGPDYQEIERYSVYDANVFLVPPEHAEQMQWKRMEHINISRITKTKNPYCVDAKSGFTLKKSFYDRQVLIL